MVCLICVRIDNNVADHELLPLLKEREGLRRDLLQSKAVPLLDDLVVDQILRN